MALVPAVVDAVGATPVVAAGGIADGRGLAAALALGAAGAWISTRFFASTEATIHPEYRQRLLAATENETVWLKNLFDVGWPDAPHRVLRNSTVANWEAAGRPIADFCPAQAQALIPNVGIEPFRQDQCRPRFKRRYRHCGALDIQLAILGMHRVADFWLLVTTKE